MSGRLRLPPALLLSLFAALLYAQTLSFQYAHDDTLVILGNRFTRSGLRGIPEILAHDSFAGFLGETRPTLPGGRYRPLALVTFALEYALFGPNPLVGHLVNALLYGALCALLFLTLRRLFPPPGGGEGLLSLPFVATALFAAHPLHTEVVANVKGRDEILGLLFSLGALSFALRHVDTGRVRHLALAGTSFLLALLSKENAVAFLFVVPLTLHVFTGAGARERRAVAAALVAALVVFLAAFRYPALGFVVGAGDAGDDLLNNPFARATPSQRYATVLSTWLVSLRLLLVPHPLTHDYYPWQIPIVGWDDPRALAALALFVAAAAYAVLRVRRRDPAAYAVLLFLLTYLPQSNLVVTVGTLLGERFLFAPSLAFCGALGWLAAGRLRGRAGGPRAHRALAGALAAAVVAGYAGQTFARSRAWRDDFTLFTTDAEVSVNSARANVMAGDQWTARAMGQRDPAARQSMLDTAVRKLERGLAILPDYPLGWMLLGHAHRHRKEFERSRACYERVLELNPGSADALAFLRELAQACGEDGRWDLAADIYLSVLRRQPGSAPVAIRLALSHANLGRTGEAVELLDRVLAANPRDVAALGALGQVHARFRGDLPRALAFFTKAYEIAPEDATVLDDLGVAYALQGDYGRAAGLFATAVERRPDSPALHEKLGNAWLRLGRAEQGRQALARARELRSGSN